MHSYELLDSSHNCRSYQACNQSTQKMNNPKINLPLPSADDYLRYGLLQAQFKPKRLEKIGPKKQRKIYTKYYGTKPEGARQISHSLLTTDNAKAKVQPGEITVKHLHMGLHVLKVYNTQEVIAGTFQVNEKTVNKNAWIVVEKISHLMKEYVVWPQEATIESEETEDEESSNEDEEDEDNSEEREERGDEDEDEEEDEDDEEDELPDLNNCDYDSDDEDDSDDYDSNDEDEDEDCETVVEDTEDPSGDSSWVGKDMADIGEKFFMSVDGVHCHINEPADPHLRKNKVYYSHKFKKAAYCYEVSNGGN